ncbi:hypothetical protein PR048_013853 [Dryococelus australis]|uniref:Uncharacterized protein n=1 Tax=Dryococelus australis TaxID=614101 RepID=A0ABQ9HU58_9NEOP|nr:hypothetical protein PR048_013853 [Dryococelus australis]
MPHFVIYPTKEKKQEFERGLPLGGLSETLIIRLYDHRVVYYVQRYKDASIKCRLAGTRHRQQEDDCETTVEWWYGKKRRRRSAQPTFCEHTESKTNSKNPVFFIHCKAY